ncbi:NDR1/HIN1-like protein 6 [Syzygium oleosum]|uniref:NDR1/HIN1-like protein 6 n=1 Tax=Syzygium oleosum TaxID=219896 RepID=UPI0011D260BC|nr:NDR1/HIN1-like protein 6 [Syzygium oleosum]
MHRQVKFAIPEAMADNQRIHPVVPAATSATAPSAPPSSSVSAKGTQVHRAFPLQGGRPVIPPKPRKRKGCCCRFLCWIISLLLLILILIGIVAAVIYFVFQPKLPQYSVDRLQISALRLNFDLTLYAQFDVKITATNPNKKIGIYYEKGGRLSVWYANDKLCEGSLPKFYQGYQNTTRLGITLTGQSESGSTIMTALQQQQQTGEIPLDLKVDAPVSVELGTMKLRKVRILGRCSLVVDSLSTNSMISIKASTCRFGMKL